MNKEQRRERSCTRKRAFSTRFYAESFLVNVLNDDKMEAYFCAEFCGDWHLGHPNPLRLPQIENAEQRHRHSISR